MSIRRPKGDFIMSNKDPYTRSEDTRFTLRINTEILNRIKDEAVKNKRSTAKEIEFILEQFLDNQSK